MKKLDNNHEGLSANSAYNSLARSAYAKNKAGIINIYKEKGYTSHDVVAVVRGLLGRIKTGHTGTLDPQAEGVLPICVGRATKLAGMLTAQNKAYRAELLLGVTTNTYDDTGEVLSESPVEACIKEITAAIQSFTGGYEQEPPMYSAIKVNGKKLYELARAGKEIERQARRVEIYGITLVNGKDGSGSGQPFGAGAPNPNSARALAKLSLWLDIECGKGTYIRSLCSDIGEKIGCGACMGELVRIRSGSFYVEDAVTLGEFRQAAESGRAEEFIIPMERALPALEGIIPEEHIKRALNGNPLPLALIKPYESDEQVSFQNVEENGTLRWLYAFLGEANQACSSRGEKKETLIGLYKIDKETLRPEVLCSADASGQ